MSNFEIKIFETKDGKKPFLIWIKSLKNLKTVTRIETRLDRIAEGNFGDYKSLGENLFELRLAFGSGYRIYYTIKDNEIVILLAGGDKSTQPKDIEKAYKYLQEYKEK
jgi:putative addiction module killer protein